MINPKMYQKPVVGIGIAAIVAVLCLAALASDSARIEKPAAVDAEQYANFIENEVFDIQDLAEGAEIQRRRFNHMTPPGFSWAQPMFPSVVPFDAENFADKFLDELLGEDKNSVAIYPLSLMQDPKTRETLVYNADGKLIAAIPPDRISRSWPEDADPARVTLQLDLLPFEDVEPYLYTESLIAEYEEARTSKTKKSGGMALRSLGATEFGIAGVQRLTNGSMRITVTNGGDTAEVYSYTVWHTFTVTTNEWVDEYGVTNIGTNTLWAPDSPPFNGIDSAWECLTTNLALSGGVGVYEDANISSNARVRFYAVANRLDSDGDGLTDGSEIFIHRTDPGNPDTDGDGLNDEWEITYGLNPLDNGQFDRNNGASGDLDNDGYLNIYEYAHGTDPADSQSIPCASIYVDAAASPNGDGSAEYPFATIQAALNAAEDYDIIQLSAGIYSGDGNVNLNYLGKPVMVQGPTSWQDAVVDCQNQAEYGVDFRMGEDNRSVLANIRICRATRSAIRGYGNTSPTIQNCCIDDNKMAFLSLVGGAWFRNCLIVRNGPGENTIQCAGDLFIDNCILADNAGGYGWDAVVMFYGDRMVVNNCTVVKNSSYPFDIWSNNTNDIRISNTIIWSNAYTLSQSWFIGSVQYSCIQGGYVGVGNITSDPQLTQSPYRLQQASPCIDAGTSAGMPPLDVMGIPRWDAPFRTNAYSTHDIGAWEFVDNDANGMDDTWQSIYGLTIPSADPDNDGLSNIQEYYYGTNPVSSDTDGDGLSDHAEIITYNTDPCRSDTDGDGVSDGDEVLVYGTNPLLMDTDGDGISDGDEIFIYGSNPLSTDSDGDGLNDWDEYRFCTDILNPDTDGDGVLDGDEVPQSPGSNPNDPDDHGDPANCVTFSLTVGDPSGSNSERWRFVIKDVARGVDVIRHQDAGFGAPSTKEYSLGKGKIYEGRVEWVATSLSSPDFDWRALVNESTATGLRAGAYYTGCFIVDDPNQLLTMETHGNDHNIAQGRLITLTTIGISGPSFVCKGDSVGFTLVGGSSPFSWTSDNTSVATVNGSGVVSGVAPGTATISVSDGIGCVSEKQLAILSVDYIEASSAVAANSPQQYDGHQPNIGNPCAVIDPTPALIIYYEDVIDGNNQLSGFDIDLNAAILLYGTSADHLSELWTKALGPDSGYLDRSDTFTAKYQNPTEGGFYYFTFDLGLNCNDSGARVLLPLAGATIDSWLEGEVIAMGGRASSWLNEVYLNSPIVGIEIYKHKVFAMISALDFDYVGQARNSAGTAPCERYSHGDTHFDDPAYVTVSGVVVHRSKFNNLLWAVFGRHLGYPESWLKAGAFYNQAFQQNQNVNIFDNIHLFIDPPSSQKAIGLGASLFINNSVAVEMPAAKTRELQAGGSLYDRKLWPCSDALDSGTSTLKGPYHILPTAYIE